MAGRHSVALHGVSRRGGLLRRFRFRVRDGSLLLLCLAALLAGFNCFPTAANAQVSDWKQIQVPALHPFHPQQPRRVELANGIVIFLQEDHELPLVRGTARIRGGSREEPADKAGLVEIYAGVWRTGGTKDKTGDQLDDYLESRAARVEAGGGLDSTTLTWDCLKDNFDEVFAIFADLLQHPEFREDKISVAQRQIDTAIARRNDEPAGIAGREAAKLGYGADSPYTRQAEYATVASVTRDDLVKWHDTYVHPNNIMIGVVGDFDSAAMEAKLRAAFESWKRGPAVAPLEVSFHGPKPGVYFVPKGDVNQSSIRMVGLGIRRDNPDYYALEVFNQIFGGSFSSRLVEDIRSKKGLAYTVYGGVGAAFDHPGLLQIGMGTKSGTTSAAIQALDQEIDEIKSKPPTAEELKKAKDSILNSFVFEFDSKAKVLAERMNYEFYGYPADFLERYRAGIEKVTRAEVERVALKYIHRDQLAVLVVGKAAEFDRPLSSFGAVTTLDISIPAPGATKKAVAAAADPHAAEEGKELLAKVIAALGGEAKVRSVQSLSRKGTMVMKSPQGEISLEVEELVAFPDQLFQRISTPMGEMTMAVSPARAFMKTPRGTQDLPASRKEDALDSVRREPLFIAQHGDDPKFTFAVGGSEKIGDVEARILDVSGDGAEVRWFVDPQTGRILRSSARTLGMGGPAEEVTDYSDYQTVDGVSVPFKEKVNQGGQEGSSEIKEFHLNAAVDPKLFEAPAKPSDSPQ